MINAAFCLGNVFKRLSFQSYSALVKDTISSLPIGLPQTLLQQQELISAGKLNPCWIRSMTVVF